MGHNQPPREGLSLARPPYFDGTDYIQWKRSLQLHVEAMDIRLWYIIEDGPFVPTKEAFDEGVRVRIKKERYELDDEDNRKITVNSKATAILINALSPVEGKYVLGCKTAKEIWDHLEMRHEGNHQVKDNKINQLMFAYESFRMDSNETISSMDT
jgi:hypothetical protein